MEVAFIRLYWVSWALESGVSVRELREGMLLEGLFEGSGGVRRHEKMKRSTGVDRGS